MCALIDLTKNHSFTPSPPPIPRPAFVEKVPNALHLAVQSHDLDAVKRLCTNVALLNQKDKDGNTPFMLACKSANHLFCEILLKAGSSTSFALHIAAEHGNESVIKLLLSQGNAGEQLKKLNSSLKTPLLLAARNGHAIICKMLVDAGAELRPSGITRSVLHEAASAGQLAIVELFVKHIELHRQDSQKLTPLHYAVKNDHLRACQVLLPYSTPLQRESCLQLAKITGNKEIETLFS